MTLYSYTFTELAKSDIDETINYVSNKLNNTHAARRLYQDIISKIHVIRSLPYAYPDCQIYLIDDVYTRRALVDNYVLIYEINEINKSITILRFLYYRRDIACEIEPRGSTSNPANN